MIKLHKINESEVKIDFSENPKAKLKLKNHLSFFAENYFFSPKYKAGFWDGRISLFNAHSNTIPIGMLGKTIEFFKHSSIKYALINKKHFLKKGPKLSTKSIEKLCKILKTPFMPKDYQMNGVKLSIYLQKMVIESVTSSGKSFMMYLILAALKYIQPDHKFLIVVPRVSLVNQLRDDFIDYSKRFDNLGSQIHTISAGKSKNVTKDIELTLYDGTIINIGEFEKVKIKVGKKTIYKRADDLNVGDDIDEKYIDRFYKKINIIKSISD